MTRNLRFWWCWDPLSTVELLRVGQSVRLGCETHSSRQCMPRWQCPQIIVHKERRDSHSQLLQAGEVAKHLLLINNFQGERCGCWPAHLLSLKRHDIFTLRHDVFFFFSQLPPRFRLLLDLVHTSFAVEAGARVPCCPLHPWQHNLSETAGWEIKS